MMTYAIVRGEQKDMDALCFESMHPPSIKIYVAGSLDSLLKMVNSSATGEDVFQYIDRVSVPLNGSP